MVAVLSKSPGGLLMFRGDHVIVEEGPECLPVFAIKHHFELFQLVLVTSQHGVLDLEAIVGLGDLFRICGVIIWVC